MNYEGLFPDLVVLALAALDLDGRGTEVCEALDGGPPDELVVLEHVVLDGADKVRLLQDPLPGGLAQRGQVRQGHQGLEVLDAAVLDVEQLAQRPDDVAGLIYTIGHQNRT